MIRCVKCGQVDAITKSGKVRGKQRYYCKSCQLYFSLDSLKNKLPLKTSGRHQATIIDIAKRLNVSKSTVSRALRNSSEINPETKNAVLRVAKELNYVPNHLAYSLVKKRSYTIGIIVPEFVGNYFPQFIIAAQEAATKAGYSVLICHSNENLSNEVENAKLLFANQVDGVLISISRETRNLDHLKMFEQAGITVILFNRVIIKNRFLKVVVDDYDGAFKGVEHLIANGYKRIGHIAGPENLYISDNRFQGYMDALKKHHLRVDEKLIVRHDLSTEGAKSSALKLLNLAKPPDAVFTVNDPAAIELIILARQKGIAVPKELGVVGFSNDARSEIISPSLTTLAHPINDLAKTAVALLLERLDEVAEPKKQKLVTTLKTNLIVRQSSLKDAEWVLPS